MVHAGDVLFDDRTFIEVARDVVRRRADDLDPARVRLVVWLGALEAGKEAVVDVDRPAGQRIAQRRREDLHVARQHDQVDPFALDQVDDAVLLLFAVFGGDRQVVEGDAVRLGERREVGVVGRDAGDLHRQLPAVHAEQQVVEAVTLLADQHHQSRLATGVVELPVHVEDFRERREAFVQHIDLGRARHVEMHAQEEAPGFVVAELLRVQDVAAGLVQETGHAIDDAGGVRAGEGQDMVAAHAGFGSGVIRSVRR